MHKNFKFATILLLILLPFQLIALGFAYYSESSFLKNSSETTAIITGMTSEKDEEGTMMYTPVYTFSLPDGREINSSPSWSSSRKPTLGDKKTVLYNNQNPDQVKSNSLFDKFTWSLILGWVVIMNLILTSVFFVLAKFVFKKESA